LPPGAHFAGGRDRGRKVLIIKPSLYQDWKLTLVVLGDDELSATARANIEQICQEELSGCRLTILDATATPEVLKNFKIFAIPTLIRQKPEPVKKIIGSLANRQVLLQELDLPKISSSSS